MSQYPFSSDRALLARFYNEYQLSEKLAPVNCMKINDDQYYLNVVNSPTSKCKGWFNNAVGTYEILPEKQGVRYLIHSIWWSCRFGAGGPAISQAYITCNSNYISGVMLQIPAAGGVIVENKYDAPGYLCPVGNKVNGTINVANLDGNYTAIRYSEVIVR